MWFSEWAAKSTCQIFMNAWKDTIGLHRASIRRKATCTCIPLYYVNAQRPHLWFWDLVLLSFIFYYEKFTFYFQIHKQNFLLIHVACKFIFNAIYEIVKCTISLHLILTNVSWAKKIFLQTYTQSMHLI